MNSQPSIPQTRWVILGAGEMGTAIAEGLRGQGAEQLILLQRNPEKRARLQERGFRAEAALPSGEGVDVVVLATKRSNAREALESIRARLTPKTWVISVLAGMTYAQLVPLLPDDQPVLRLRPNLFIRDGRGNLLISAPPSGPSEDSEALIRMLRGLGQVFLLPESLMERATWASSSIALVVIPKLLTTVLEAVPSEHRAAHAEMMVSGLRGLLGFLTDQEAEGRPVAGEIEALCRSVITPGGINDAAMQTLEGAHVWQTFDRAFTA